MPPTPKRPLGLVLLTGVVVGSMLATGAFTAPGSFAKATGPLGLVLALAIVGAGTLTLALVFQRLAQRRPDLDAGVFAYAQAGFGPMGGFVSAFGYWAGACLLNVSYFVLMKATFGAIVPAFGDGNTPQAVLAASCLLWAIHFLILRGVKEAAVVNAVVTLAKVSAVAAAVVVLAAGFRLDAFTANFWGGGTYSWAELPGQVRSALIIAVYVFLGIEGASVYSRFAKHRRDVGRATLLGLSLVALLFILLSLLPFGILPREEIAALRYPSLAGVLGTVAGPWGAWFVAIALVTALSGAFLARSLLAAEVLHAAARAGTVPQVFAREDANGTPRPALWLSTAAVQAFLLASLVAESAYAGAIRLTSVMMLLPYLFVALFALRVVRSEGGRPGEGAIAAIAVAYALVMLWAAGPTLLFAATLIYAPATLVYWRTRRRMGERPLGDGGAFATLALAMLAAAAALALLGGRLAI